MKILILVLALGFVFTSAFPFGGFGLHPAMLGPGLGMMGLYGGLGFGMHRPNRRLANRHHVDEYDDMHYNDNYNDERPRHAHKGYARQKKIYESESHEPYSDTYLTMDDGYKTKNYHSDSYNDKEYKYKKDYHDIEPHIGSLKSIIRDYNKYESY